MWQWVAAIPWKHFAIHIDLSVESIADGKQNSSHTSKP
jgi:hypothetical protein